MGVAMPFRGAADRGGEEKQGEGKEGGRKGERGRDGRKKKGRKDGRRGSEDNKHSLSYHYTCTCSRNFLDRNYVA